MAKNKNNSPRNYSKNSSKNTTSNSSGSSMKDSHAQVPDNSPGRSGPGGN